MDPADEALVADLERLAPMAEGGLESLRGLVEKVLGEPGEDLDRMLQRDLNMRAARWYADHLGDAEAAEARYRGAIAADQDTQEAHARLVELLRVPGREKPLVAALVQWAEIDFDERAKIERLADAAALAESALGEPALAIRCYEKIMEVDGVHAAALDQLIRLEDDAGNSERVAELLATRIDAEMDPDARLTLRKQLAAAFAKLDRTSEAIAAWQGALGEVPEDLDAIGALEVLYEKDERWGELEDLINRRLGIASSPAESIAARVRLARLAESRFGRRDDAITQLREILVEDPGNEEALDELERLHTTGKEWDELVELLERRIADAQRIGEAALEIDILVRLGTVHVEHRADAERGVEIYRRVLDRAPDHDGALSALLHLHRQHEDWASALDVMEQISSRSDGDEAVAGAFEIAELAEEKLGDASRAEAALRRAYEISGGSRASRDKLKTH